METEYIEQSVIWGRTYEIFTKRGALSFLVQAGIINQSTPEIKKWTEINLGMIFAGAKKAMRITDIDFLTEIQTGLEHQAVTG